MKNINPHITAIILAGGKSSRMGQDKGLMLLNGKYFVQHVIDAVSSLASDIIIVSNQSEYEVLGYRVEKDIIKENGPLAGIYTGLVYSQHNINIVLSCDVPLISTKMLEFLLNHNSESYDVTLPSFQNKIHYLIGVYHKRCAEPFMHELRKGQLRVKTALEKVIVNIVNTNHFHAGEFLNINTPQEFQNLIICK
jgi:molybdopterin-guanine dinucleotide biosynthesis protein A